MNQSPFIFYCRPGFESDCAGEVQEFANTYDLAGYANTKPDSGYVRFYLFDEQSEQTFFDELDLEDLIFVRQWFWAKAELEGLDLSDRVTPIVEASSEVRQAKTLLVEHLDNDSGRELSKFCKMISTPMTIALEKRGILQSKHENQLHVLFIANDHCVIGYSPIGKSSTHKSGIVRLKAHRDAPGRSSLKLDEAIQTFMSRTQQNNILRLGNSAVDLGGAPGAWAFQLVQRGMQVTVIDNGAMDQKLMATEHVVHLKENPLTWKPKKPVDLMVCDMVEKPSLIAELVARWLVKANTEQVIFNLKLPMKKRFQEVGDCIDLICDKLEAEDIQYHWQAKHLYHDREEITCYFRRKIIKLH